MGHRPVLDLPTRLPLFATDAGSTVEPGQTDKELGHAVGTRPPARWQNDWQNLVYEWVQKMSGVFISDVALSSTTGTTDHYCSIGYPTDLNHVIVVESDKSVVEVSHGGDDEQVQTPLTYDPQKRCVTTDSAGRVIVAVGADAQAELLRIQYSTDVSGAWSTTSSSAFDTPSAISSEGSDGTGIMVGGIWGGMYYASVATGTLAAVTAPGYTETGADRKVVGIMRVATDSWMIVTVKGEVFTTANNGSTWTAGTDISGTEDFSHASINSTTGRVVAVGDDNIYYSDNNGSTWTTSTIKVDNERFSSVTYTGECAQWVGGELWLSSWFLTGTSGYLIGSYDDGETWFLVWADASTTLTAIYDIGCAANTTILAADTGAIYRTRLIPGGA